MNTSEHNNNIATAAQLARYELVKTPHGIISTHACYIWGRDSEAVLSMEVTILWVQSRVQVQRLKVGVCYVYFIVYFSSIRVKLVHMALDSEVDS